MADDKSRSPRARHLSLRGFCPFVLKSGSLCFRFLGFGGVQGLREFGAEAFCPGNEGCLRIRKSFSSSLNPGPSTLWGVT